MFFIRLVPCEAEFTYKSMQLYAPSLQTYTALYVKEAGPFKSFVILPEKNLANKEPTAADKEVWQI